MKYLFLFFIMCIGRTQASSCRIRTVRKLDLDKYSGRWFEMYNSLIPRLTFQRNSFCTTATYTIVGDSIRVLNAGRRGGPRGLSNTADGTATRPNPRKYPGEIIVNFPGGSPPSTSPNYLVVKLGPVVNGKYDYAIVTTVNKAYFWILARDVNTFRVKYEQSLLEYASCNGYNTNYNRPLKSVQGVECVY
ncbi:uncharacterized protein [Clytia hemisphaerica]|uniref:Lipocalin/cytosolic fatty-acid binding domain-containing protein n=1 Tax=Clytia hemisphaerica TaxID=252671 RepID=A0A7M5VC20_9CNID